MRLMSALGWYSVLLWWNVYTIEKNNTLGRMLILQVQLTKGELPNQHHPQNVHAAARKSSRWGHHSAG